MVNGDNSIMKVQGEEALGKSPFFPSHSHWQCLLHGERPHASQFLPQQTLASHAQACRSAVAGGSSWVSSLNGTGLDARFPSGPGLLLMFRPWARRKDPCFPGSLPMAHHRGPEGQSDPPCPSVLSSELGLLPTSHWSKQAAKEGWYATHRL